MSLSLPLRLSLSLLFTSYHLTDRNNEYLHYLRGWSSYLNLLSCPSVFSGQFWQASRSRDCDDVYAHHHPAAIGLPYPPRPGSGSGLRPKPFIAKGPVLASDAVPEGEKREFEAQSEGEKGEFEVQVVAVEVEVDDEELRQEQGEGEKASTIAGLHISSLTISRKYRYSMPRHTIPSHCIHAHLLCKAFHPI